MDQNSVKVEGHKGTWYVVEEVKYLGDSYYLLEHNTYGEDADWVAIDSAGQLVLEDITEGKAELLEHLRARR